MARSAANFFKQDIQVFSNDNWSRIFKFQYTNNHEVNGSCNWKAVKILHLRRIA